MENKYFGLILFAIFFCGFVAGAGAMLYSDFQYKEASVKTCLYANNLTKIINQQSDTLSLFTGTNYTRLDNLNCDLLIKGG